MSEIPEELNLQREEFQSELDWIEPLLRRLNLFSTQVVRGLKDLAIGPNVAGQIETVRVATGATVEEAFPIKFALKMPRRPRVLQVGLAQFVDAPSTTFTDAVFPTWQVTANGVSILHLTGLTTNTKYVFNFVLFP